MPAPWQGNLGQKGSWSLCLQRESWGRHEGFLEEEPKECRPLEWTGQGKRGAEAQRLDEWMCVSGGRGSQEAPLWLENIPL